jgi:hypothetical protein
VNDYLIVAEGEKFTVYINDLRIGQFFDYAKTRAKGLFAFLAWQESGRSSCEYKDSWVWLLE